MPAAPTPGDRREREHGPGRDRPTSNGKQAESRGVTVSRAETIPRVSEEDNRPAPITTENATTAGPSHLPSPLPSPRDGFGTSSPFSNSAPTGRTRLLIDMGVDGMGLDLSQGFPSCAVSEADTDAPNSALESSSTDGLPASSDSHAPQDPQDTPKRDKQPSRTSSAARRTRDRSGTKSSDHSSVRRLSATKIQELTASPDSLPIAPLREPPLSASIAEATIRASMATAQVSSPAPASRAFDRIESSKSEAFGSDIPFARTLHSERPAISSRTISTPAQYRKSAGQASAPPPSSSRRNSFQPSPRPAPLDLEASSNLVPSDTPKPHISESHSRHESRDLHDQRDPRAPSPMPPSFPIPPLSAPTFLQLELAAQRPSPLYVYQSYTSDIPYESSAVKFERLKNFLLLPPYLERTLVVGALACLDAWLWTLTILPLRFFLAVKVLVGWWGYLIAKEARWLVAFVWEGLGRMRQRGRMGLEASGRPRADSRMSSEAASRSPSRAREPLKELGVNATATGHAGPAGPAGPNGESVRRTHSARAKSGPNGLGLPPLNTPRAQSGRSHHRRTKSLPSSLSSFHKADLLQFAVIIVSSLILTQLDASRMYHFIRAQSAVKLYVIYNLVEVGLLVF